MLQKTASMEATAMKNDRSMRRNANQILSKYHIANATLDNLIYILEDQGYEIIDYSSDSLEENDVISRLQFDSLAKSAKAFTYSNGHLHFVFVRIELTADEKLVALAHEEGHIACGHLDKKNVSSGNIQDEYDANEFAHYFLHPSVIRKVRTILYTHKPLSIVGLIAILLLIIAVPVILHFSEETQYYGDYYITDSGEKYHEASCIFIKDKTNVRKMTIKEFESGGYEPCQICLPGSMNNN